MGAINLRLEFEKVQQKKGAVHWSLDEWLVGLDKCVLDPKPWFKANVKQPSSLEDRKELCEAGLRLRLQKPKTFLRPR